MTHNYRKEHLGDGAFARVEDDRSLVITAENGISIQDEVHFDPMHIPALVRYIKEHFPIAFAQGTR